MTAASTAAVPTANASRYLQQLCKHWQHKLDVTFTPDVGSIAFPGGATLGLTAYADRLDLRLDVPHDGDLERMQGVVADHLNRFAFREGELAFDWQAA
jgi:hypothetical protein